MVTAFARIKAEFSRIAALAEQLADVDGVAEVYSVSGEDDLIAIIRVPHYDDVADVVTHRMAVLPGVQSCRTEFAFRAYSRKDLDALWSIGME